MNISFIGKTLLVEEDGLRVLAVGDLHLGFAEAARRAGKGVPMDLLGDMIGSLEDVFEEIEKVDAKEASSLDVTKSKKPHPKGADTQDRLVDTVVLLGDVKQVFGAILPSEREEFGKLVGFLKKWCEKIVVVKGNHDVLLDFMGVETVVSYRVGDVCFVHGDKTVVGIEDCNTWVMGHGHPAIVLKDDVKEEKFPCFLDGSFEGRRVIVLPSFSPANVGSDAREWDLGLAWDFDLESFLVWVVGDDGEVREMGRLGGL
ncbi:hypothetical protein CMI48_02340 [Candidatus Pacearchaeota archaeon]|nr:hypothetical protein [Candidatus Pacearchaeota archaeon]